VVDADVSGVGTGAGVAVVVLANRGEPPPSRSRFSLSRSRSRSLATASTYPPTSVATCLTSLDLESVRVRNARRESIVGCVESIGHERM
jgi:hypothetical protein